MSVSKKGLLAMLGIVAATGSIAYAVSPGQTVEPVRKGLCSMPGRSAYSPGALARHENSVYRCVYVYGDNLRTTGVAWVKMTETFSLADPERAEGR